MIKDIEVHTKTLLFNKEIGKEALEMLSKIDKTFICGFMLDAIIINIPPYCAGDKLWYATNILANKLTERYPDLKIQEQTEKHIHTISEEIDFEVLSIEDIERNMGEGFW